MARALGAGSIVEGCTWFVEQILLRPSEAAKTLGVCRATLRTLIHAGEIPHVRLGGSIRVPADRLKAAIDARIMPESSNPEAE